MIYIYIYRDIYDMIQYDIGLYYYIISYHIM